MSQNVNVFSISVRKDRPKPYQVRWRLDGRFHSESFRVKSAAEKFRAKLLSAEGELWDAGTGRPASWGSAAVLTVATYLQQWMRERWPSWAANSRASAVEGLTSAVVCQVSAGRGRPESDTLREAVRNVWLRPDATPTTAQAAALDWLDRNSLPLRSVPEDLVKATLLDMSQKLDGSGQVSPNTYRRRRQVYHQALKDAVESNPPKVDRHPLTGLRNPMKGGKVTSGVKAVDRSIVASPALVRELLEKVSTIGRTGDMYRAVFALLYFAGVRPSEVVAVMREDLTLPAEGWGTVKLRGSAPRVGGLWTDDGAPVDHRGLKHREDGVARSVPIPPELVEILRSHCANYPNHGGRLFSNSQGGMMSTAKIAEMWRDVRALQWPDKDPGTVPVPYALRHSCASLWLSAGVPITEVARRLGHTPDVLLRVYAHALAADEATANTRIEEALS